MATKIQTTELKVGMFVADLDRPWVDTPFLLQGFLIEDEAQIRELRTHCEFVIIDRARSTGDQYAALPASATNTIPPSTVRRAPALRAESAVVIPSAAEIDAPPPEAARAAPRTQARVIRLEEVLARRPHGGALAEEEEAQAPDHEPGFLRRLFSARKRRASAPEPSASPVRPTETAEEFAARAELLPPGITVHTYYDEVPVEQEVPRARALITNASNLLAKFVSDITTGQSFEVERVEEIVDDMVESIIRNPDAMMWLARLREQDITTYGHGLQVSVYLTAFGRHLGFPKAQLGLLAQVGLLLDIGKIRLPREILEKQGRLNPEEFEQAKGHVSHSLEILARTPNFDPEVLEAIAQHHERMNGSGYPKGLVGEEIGIFGRMAGIVDCFAAITKRRPYSEPVSAYEALRSLTGWGGEFFHDALVQQFVTSIGVFPVGSLIELSTGEVAVVVEHNKVRRLKPRILVVTGPDKTPAAYPTMVDLIYEPKMGGDKPAFIKRGLAPGAYGLDLNDFYLS